VTALVVGLGSPDRGDDAVGPAVAAGVAALGLSGVEVMVRADPSALVDLMDSHDVVVLVDAMRSGAVPGQVAVMEAGQAPVGIASGTHDLGLGEVIELARVLDRLPPRVVIVAIEAADFDHGEPMSPAVELAVPAAVRAVVGSLEGLGSRRLE
jgi:hydrogenase maturation protease